MVRSVENNYQADVCVKIKLMKNIYNDLHNVMGSKIWFEIMYQISFQLPMKVTHDYGMRFVTSFVPLQIKTQK